MAMVSSTDKRQMVWKWCQAPPKKKNWSNRTEIKVIRLARTISDLQGYEHISDQSLWEAVKLNSRGEVKNRKGDVLPMM
jgi:predicted ATPase with chaperone activity